MLLIIYMPQTSESNQLLKTTHFFRLIRISCSYMAHIASIIAKAQITNGGPVILYQPENEYSAGNAGVVFPNKPYFQYVIDQARNAGIVVPLINNDAFPGGTSAPGTGLGSVDIYVYLPVRCD